MEEYESPRIPLLGSLPGGGTSFGYEIFPKNKMKSTDFSVSLCTSASAFSTNDC